MEDWKLWKEGGCGSVADKVAPRRVQSAEARRRDGGWLGFLSVFAPSLGCRRRRSGARVLCHRMCPSARPSELSPKPRTDVSVIAHFTCPPEPD